jgi:uncharacterized protein YndB with AHSA1/START domain
LDFDAPAELVWNAWTEPAWVSRWFGSDPNGKVNAAEMDLRPGGRFEVNFENGDGSQHTCRGVYKEVVPFRHLAFTWEWKSEPGIVSFVRIELSPSGQGTRMNFEHAHAGTKSEHQYLEGWKSSFAKLQKTLTRHRK